MTTKIWGVLEGPMEVGKNDPFDHGYILVCKIEIDGQIEDSDFWFETLDEAYHWKRYFDKNMEPLVLNDKQYWEYVK